MEAKVMPHGTKLSSKYNLFGNTKISQKLEIKLIYFFLVNNTFAYMESLIQSIWNSNEKIMESLVLGVFIVSSSKNTCKYIL